MVVNTCTVTHRSDRDARALIRRARRENPSARVVVAGCLAEVDPEGVLGLGADLVAGSAAKAGSRGTDRLRRFGDRAEGITGPLPAAEPPAPVTRFGRSRAFLKVQDGCDAGCAYCIVPRARGAPRSLPPEEVAAGLARLREGGHREVVLAGIHLGRWGCDLAPPRRFAELLDLAENSGIGRVRLSSLEPLELTEEVIGRTAASPTLCPHFHVPLQSGSDAVLRRMGRPYTAGEFRERVEAALHRIEGLCLGFDVIVGLPGETEEEFLRTERLLESLPFCYLHVFPYSRRRGTPAADMDGQVAEGEKSRRAARLRELARAKKEAFVRARVGRTLPALAEGEPRGGTLQLRTRNYVEVLVPWRGETPRHETAVRLLSYENGKAWGEAAEST